MQTSSKVPAGVNTSVYAWLPALRSVALCPLALCIVALWIVALCPAAQAAEMLPACPAPTAPLASSTVTHPSVANMEAAIGPMHSTLTTPTAIDPPAPFRKLIVIGFMGGKVRANDFVHREASMARDLEQRYPMRLDAAVFANRDGQAALQTVLQFLDKDENGCLSPTEKSAARIVIYGHSWGASQTVTLAHRLNELDIPVLLTIQVDSVQKLNEHDGRIPPNVREAVNFYQSEGLLHGRPVIEAMDPNQTRILGNFESSYKDNPVSCAGFPWYARTFMKRHIQIENDPLVWNRIEALIQAKLL